MVTVPWKLDPDRNTQKKLKTATAVLNSEERLLTIVKDRPLIEIICFSLLLQEKGEKKRSGRTKDCISERFGFKWKKLLWLKWKSSLPHAMQIVPGPLYGIRRELDGGGYQPSSATGWCGLNMHEAASMLERSMRMGACPGHPSWKKGGIATPTTHKTPTYPPPPPPPNANCNTH